MGIKIKSIVATNNFQLTGDIEVDVTHSYQLDNGAVSHNSILLQTASGIHPEHSRMYIRNAQMNKETEVAKLLMETNPYMIEESVWSANKTDYVVSFPVIPPKTSVYREDMYGVKLLEKVKLVQQSWVESGTNLEHCVDKTVRHNVSNTITVPDDMWDEVEEYVFSNRKYFSGISFLSATGDKAYYQAPMTEVLTEEEIVSKYGRAAMFASGLIVDTAKGFNNLWEAISIAKMGEDHYGEASDIRKDWIRRFAKYTENFFDGDIVMSENCLKDVYLLYRWSKIQRNLTPVDFVSQLSEKSFTDIDTMGAIACHGGVCEL